MTDEKPRQEEKPKAPPPPPEPQPDPDALYPLFKTNKRISKDDEGSSQLEK